MVDPVLLLALPFAVAFLLPLAERAGHGVAAGLHGMAVLAGLAISVQWLVELGPFSDRAVDIVTGGWPAPWGIVLRLGWMEAGLLALAYGVALIAGLELEHRDRDAGVKGRVLQLMMLVGAAGLILSRDLFNIFVFVEITGIATYALVLYGREEPGLEAGLKYMLMSAVAGTLILLATGLLYGQTGTLFLDDMAAKATGAGLAVLVLLMVGFLIELKLFPVNGPAIDLYDGTDPGVMALVVGTALNAAFFAFAKVAVLFPDAFFNEVMMAIGLGTYVIANLFALRQDRVRRLLGYSSSAQIGLLVFLWPVAADHPDALFAVAVLLANHTLAKAGLLWLAGAHGGERLDDWRGTFAIRPWTGIVLAVLVLSVAALPPFPGFWGKWEALVTLARDDSLRWWILPLLIGAFFEWAYYFGWLRRAFEPAIAGTGAGASTLAPAGLVAPGLAVALLAVFGGVLFADRVAVDMSMAPAFLLIGTGVVLVFLRGLPHRLSGVLMLATVAMAAWMLIDAGPVGHPLAPLFLLFFVGGALVVGVGGLAWREGFGEYHGLLLILVGALVMVVKAVGVGRTDGLLLFFAAWETATWATVWIIGRRSPQAGYLYVLFSAVAGFLILGGLMVAQGLGTAPEAPLASLTGTAALVAWSLIAAGAAVKLGAWGVHIWAQKAYAESPDFFTPYLAGVVSKAPVFVLVTVCSAAAVDGIPTFLGTIEPQLVLAWVGALTTLGMALLAALQEDAKRMLAYSSIGQVSYALTGIALATPLGWTAALYIVINHFLFKSLLFLAIAGVSMRTGTDTMWRMGGLIKKMPVTFISVLIGIIAASGVPPLSGFAAKWLVYEAMVDSGWLFVAAVTMMSAMVTFLYLYRLIHTIFLGQLKVEHRAVREAPLLLLVPQVVLVAAIMVLSVWPQTVLGPITDVLNAPGGIVEPLPGVMRPEYLSASVLVIGEGTRMITPLGYFDPVAAMVLVMVLFAAVFGALLLLLPKAKWVKQSDMVYAAELPPPPDQAHFAFAMFRPYERALAPILVPRVTRFWEGAADTVNAVAEAGRRFYSGSPQAYLLYAVALIVFLAWAGGS